MTKIELEKRLKELQEENEMLQNDVDYWQQSYDELYNSEDCENIIDKCQEQFDRWSANFVYQMKRFNLWTDEIENLFYERTLDFYDNN